MVEGGGGEEGDQKLSEGVVMERWRESKMHWRGKDVEEGEGGEEGAKSVNAMFDRWSWVGDQKTWLPCCMRRAVEAEKDQNLVNQIDVEV